MTGNKNLILVDFDDTLIYSGQIWSNANKVQFARNNIEYNPEEFNQRMAHKMFDQTVQMIHDVYLPGLPVEEIEAELVSLVIEEYEHCELNTDLIEFLKSGIEAGVDIRIFTANKHYLIEPSLKRMGLEMIDVHHCTGKYANKKDMLHDIILDCPDVTNVIVIDDNAHVRESVRELQKELDQTCLLWAYHPEIIQQIKDVLPKVKELWQNISQFLENVGIKRLIDEARKDNRVITMDELMKSLSPTVNSDM